MDPIYIVLLINLIIWAGVFLYINKTDRATKRLKQEIEKLNLEQNSKEK